MAPNSETSSSATGVQKSSFSNRNESSSNSITGNTSNTMRKKRVAIIGAGVSGILSIKSCKEEQESFEEIVCYEKTSSFGGLWKFREFDDEDTNYNNNRISSGVGPKKPETITVMESTIANSSKEMSAFSDFPPDPKTPNYMHHKVMFDYINSYAKKFDCMRHVKFNHEIIEISRAKGSAGFKIILKDHSSSDGCVEKNEYFDCVMICTGHHGRPYIPNLPGMEKFRGEIIHTQNYKRPDKFKGKNVVVVGVGNSGLDAAVEISNVADQVYLSTRSGCWVLPRAGFRGGRPYDTSFLRRSMHFLKDNLPTSVISYVIETMLNRRFDHELFGLRPAHPLFYEHPTVNDQVSGKILCGRIQVRGDIEYLEYDGVVFEGHQTLQTNIMNGKTTSVTNGGVAQRISDEEVKTDAIILATGFHVDYPFLSKSLRQQILNPDNNSVKLYKYVFPVDEDNQDDNSFSGLGFIGVPNALGPLFPIAEIQSRWMVQVMIGNSKLPPASVMRRELLAQDIRRKEKFTSTPRHGVQVEWIPYLDEISNMIGAKPDFWLLFKQDFKLWSRLYFGPAVPYQYRLQGPHSWPEAKKTILSVQERIEAPLRTSKRKIRMGKDLVSVNPLYVDHSLIFKLLFAIIGTFLMDQLFLWAP